MNSALLKNIRIVMVQTWHPGNIGAAARAMKTMGLNDLVLVNPVDYPHAEADSLAAGALDVLKQARVVSSLEEAIVDCQLVLATSARTRSHPWPIKEAREAAPQIVTEAQQGKVAILFGPERMGLHNDDLRQAHFHVDIPGNPEYGVLNVSSAVQLVCYEIFMAQRESYESTEQAYPQVNELNLFYQHLENTLDKVGFLIKAHPGQAMLRLKRLFNRARPEKTELNMLRGMLSSIDKLDMPTQQNQTTKDRDSHD
ncbi:MAG: tRNA (cytidine32/uridine32-2'-O)-methyltransferase [Crocinitomicaceae bacterium]|jgi:tRNA (cytidine32/uridine32-2'-O)-methyltransferase